MYLRRAFAGRRVSARRCTARSRGGTEGLDLERVKEPEDWNSKLEWMSVRLALDHAAMKDQIAKKTAGPEQECEAMQNLAEVHRRPLHRSREWPVCCAAWYRSLQEWTVVTWESLRRSRSLVEDWPDRAPGSATSCRGGAGREGARSTFTGSTRRCIRTRPGTQRSRSKGQRSALCATHSLHRLGGLLRIGRAGPWASALRFQRRW